MFTSFAGAATFDDFIESSKVTVKVLRDKEKVDVVIYVRHAAVAVVLVLPFLNAAMAKASGSATWG